MKKFAIALLLTALVGDVLAFCGFYVAKADAKLFNKSSQVIIVRDGTQSTITMANDFQGEVKDFAMVVPVPEVLRKDQIKVVSPAIFSKIDAYTAPRVAEYYDENPCYIPVDTYDDFSMAEISNEEVQKPRKMYKEKDLGVKIEAEYEVGEYDILILSATESSGLETWLIQNGYKIPSGAKEVLTPYIRSNMKFFVVKVNLERHSESLFTQLSPLQITFNSGRFMLPIRLGMANAQDDQDLVIYTFTRQGRVETTNYRTAALPTDTDLPLFIQDDFGPFYKNVFEKSWKREGKDAVMLEYAWDISGSQQVKCDPCATQPFTLQELQEAGVRWVTPSGGWGANYAGELFISRLHVRYNRQTFPQDLAFQITPNRERFQCRYVTRHPATGDLSCDDGQQYLVSLIRRRQQELQNYQRLTGENPTGYADYVMEYARLIKPENRNSNEIIPVAGPAGPGNKGPDPIPYGMIIFGILGLGGTGLLFRILENRMRRRVA